MNNELLNNLYGLQKNPFAPEFGEELFPSNCEDLTLLYAKVEGFGRQVSFIDNWFTKPGNLAKSNCILICGFDGSGRTSVVNYIIWRFCEAKKINLKQITLIETIVKNEHDIEPIQDLLKELCTYLNKLLGKKFTEEYGDLKKDYREQVLYNKAPGTQRAYNYIFSESKPILNSQDIIPIVKIENINNYQQVHIASEVFSSADVIIYTTTSSEVYQQFIQEHSKGNIDGFSVSLTKLNLQDVINFICWRWEKCCEDNKEHPFDEDGLKLVFENPMPFKGVVKIITEAFNNHIEIVNSKSDFHCNSESLIISRDRIIKAAMDYFNPR
ncbi:hypothetical protein [Microcoleus sp. S13_B4]|uniref:hypothetical protein n=1 Tax=Microcoleus sp. S13_B4 TaxID=3055408 RepID=UPI002FD03B99